ncbi:hypothetical protein, partial [Deinococcus sp.]|uniref:hypothetical protein n=1 Tax=Deinococcus sp. TaxID=47478 RepID=UPI00286992DE
THFSDWGSVPGMQLSPDVATVRVGQSLPLTVVVCDDLPPGQGNTHGFPVLACDSNVVLNKVARHWSVNGVAGGNATIGTVGVNGSGEAVYTAPARAPNPNPVAVSAQISSLVDKTLYTLVSTVKVMEPAKGWQGKVTYHEEGSATYPPTAPMTGHVQESFLYDETQTITEAALDDPTYPEDFTLKLGAVATGSVAESAYTREESSTCSGGYVTEHWWESATDLNGKDSVESHLHVDPDGSYAVHLEPIGATGERHETHRDKVTAVCPPPDPSYDESGTWSGPAFVNGQDADLEGRIDPQRPDTISGTITRAGEQGEVPTTVTIHWEFHRLP